MVVNKSKQRKVRIVFKKLYENYKIQTLWKFGEIFIFESDKIPKSVNKVTLSSLLRHPSAVF